ncbi:hypothetical protein HIM_09009 [Hirsutella minnesotensis 3608]|uniref:Choline transport protein n=1 Tax=Hirsutella minnesotensis 3608 TaxID=1043627 RepID=A0A0F7ZM04_9HYPO|nr:hypothetical protein HIM_09009 [Hirsutella minnesotensis 3608]
MAMGSRDGDDAAALQQLGHAQELKRNFSLVSMLGLAFATVNTWLALCTSLNLTLPSGGCSALIWGLVTAGICNLCLAASLAEFLSAYPTAGGQYHWAAIIAWKDWSRSISYTTGWINTAGWVAVSASGGLLGSTFVVNIITLLRDGYEAKPWHQFLIYIGFTVLALFVNAFFTRLLPYFTKAAFYWSIGGFVVVTVTVISCASPNYQSGTFVYGNFINQVGWPDGVAWLLGLLQGAFGLTAFDATAHMIEEIPEPHKQGPRIMLYCILIGVFTGFIFLSALMFSLQDVEKVINAPYGSLLQIFMDATKSRAGSVCLMMIPTVGMVFAMTTLLCASSRMNYAFARDRGMPFSHVFARVHPQLDVPLNALLWTTGWVVVFGFIFLGSTSTFNAITAASVVALGVTYAIPPSINVLRGRKMLPPSRYFKIPEPLGWIVNLVGIMWTILTTVLFVFPPKLPVTASNMNYCIVAFGVILLIAALTWIFDGRRNYSGPKIDVQSMLVGKVEGLDGEIDAPKLRELKASGEELDGAIR